MKFIQTKVLGVFVIEIESKGDERGFFARIFCREEFRKAGLNPCIQQISISFNKKTGTLRGMHYQRKPYEEAKVVRCTAGCIYDVALDLRQASPTFRNWIGLELSAEKRTMLYIPEGVAHGFQTLCEGCEVLYQMSRPFHPASAAGVRWDDPAFQIEWPDCKNRILSQRDRDFPDFK